jgi:hypothetical protein
VGDPAQPATTVTKDDHGGELECATAFGLDVHATTTPALLRNSAAAPTGRVVELELAQDELSDEPLRWPTQAMRISDEVDADGEISLCIEAHSEAGYLISGPIYGAQQLSPEGHRVRCFVRGAPQERWQRLLIAQTLPFAALLHGLEVFHASAIVRDGEAVAFVGPSRAGKTSLALELCAHGAHFLADDVLALERNGETLLGHPGSPVASVDADGEAGERLISVRGAEAPAELAALFFINRRVDGPRRPTFAPVDDPRTLLAATFNFVLKTPRRLGALLDVCALAARRRVELVELGPQTSVDELADAVSRRLDERP